MSVDQDAFDGLDSESLKQVIAHSSDSNARACAWELLDKMTDPLDLGTLDAEIETLRKNSEKFK